MSAEIATLDRVRQAAERLRRNGVRPTADRVIELIGGGKATVLEHLRTLRATPMVEDEVPSSVVDMVRSALEDVYRAGRNAEVEKVRTATEKMSQFVDEQDAQIAELMLDLERLSSANEQLERQLEAGSVSVAEADERARNLEIENAELKSQLAAARASASEELRQALERVEQMVISAAGIDKKAARPRRTIGLPNKKSDG